jgi:hypothetical protein
MIAVENSYTATKYKNIISFHTKYKKLPDYNSSRKPERQLRLFLTNKKNQLQRSERGLAKKLEPWELKYINLIDSLKETVKTKLTIILNFCLTNKYIPKYITENEKEKEVARKLNTIYMLKKTNRLTADEKEIYKQIMEFKKRRREIRFERIKTLLAFCEELKRTPKQHVKDIKEKRLAEFLTTLKVLNKHNKLNAEERALLNQILKFAPAIKINKISK